MNVHEQEQALLVLVTGLPGTGKTTFGSALAQRIGATHFNSDSVRESMHLRGYYEEETKKKVYRQMENLTEQALQAGRSVVVDATFYKEQVRKPYRTLALESGARFVLIELVAEEAVVKKRVSQQRPLTDADFEVYRAIKHLYEPLEEPHLVLHSDQSAIAEMLEETLHYLKQPISHKKPF